MSISKPQSAYQFYLKAWKEIPAEEKAYFEDKAKRDLQRYKEQYKQIEYAKEAEVKEKEIYLKAYTGGYSASGLDNGARSYEIIGPVVKIVEYTEEKSNYLDVKVKEYHYRDSNNIKCVLHHNKQYQLKYPGNNPVYTYGKTYSSSKDRAYNPIKKFTVCENKPEYVGCYTCHYTSFDNKTWTTYH
jgi:hypothetical protein